MTDAQIKALFTFLEYNTQLVVEISKDTKILRTRIEKRLSNPGKLRDQNARLRQELRSSKAEIKRLNKALNDQFE